jgi:hypothetical protein
MQKCLTLDEEKRPNFAQIQGELATFLEKNSGELLHNFKIHITVFYYSSPFSAEYGYLQLNE